MSRKKTTLWYKNDFVASKPTATEINRPYDEPAIHDIGFQWRVGFVILYFLSFS